MEREVPHYRTGLWAVTVRVFIYETFPRDVLTDFSGCASVSPRVDTCAGVALQAQEQASEPRRDRLGGDGRIQIYLLGFVFLHPSLTGFTWGGMLAVTFRGLGGEDMWRTGSLNYLLNTAYECWAMNPSVSCKFARWRRLLLKFHVYINAYLFLSDHWLKQAGEKYHHFP